MQVATTEEFMRSLGATLRKTKKVFKRAVAKAAAAGTSVRFTNKEVCCPYSCCGLFALLLVVCPASHHTWPIHVGIWLQPLGYTGVLGRLARRLTL